MSYPLPSRCTPLLSRGPCAAFVGLYRKRHGSGRKNICLLLSGTLTPFEPLPPLRTHGLEMLMITFTCEAWLCLMWFPADTRYIFPTCTTKHSNPGKITSEGVFDYRAQSETEQHRSEYWGKLSSSPPSHRQASIRSISNKSIAETLTTIKMLASFLPCPSSDCPLSKVRSRVRSACLWKYPPPFY